jgi:hypothetical protein
MAVPVTDPRRPLPRRVPKEHPLSKVGPAAPKPAPMAPPTTAPWSIASSPGSSQPLQSRDRTLYPTYPPITATRNQPALAPAVRLAKTEKLACEPTGESWTEGAVSVVGRSKLIPLLTTYWASAPVPANKARRQTPAASLAPRVAILGDGYRITSRWSRGVHFRGITVKFGSVSASLH